jgi:5,10-methylenetetrahydrofolate reductase
MTAYPATLEQKLANGTFVYTAEVCPPKGADCSEFLDKAIALKGVVDALNVTDNQGAHMRISPLAAAALLLAQGIEPVFQITCRDRNRLALQSDLLGAAALGVRNVLALTGDHISFGDHREAQAVFDLDSVQLLAVINRLMSGVDLAGKKLHGTPSFFAGAAAAPDAEPFQLSLFKLGKKTAAGAAFFQTQAVFAPERFRNFAAAVAPLDSKLIAGILLLKSAGMARFINAHIPGLHIPEDIIVELEQSGDPARTGLEIACRIARTIKPWCHGLHIMAMGHEEHVPAIIRAAETSPDQD